MSQEKYQATQALLRMANQIAANIGGGHTPEETSSRIAQHLIRFWTPKMRQDLVMAATADADLSPLVREAITIMQTEQQQATQFA